MDGGTVPADAAAERRSSQRRLWARPSVWWLLAVIPGAGILKVVPALHGNHALDGVQGWGLIPLVGVFLAWEGRSTFGPARAVAIGLAGLLWSAGWWWSMAGLGGGPGGRGRLGGADVPALLVLVLAPVAATLLVLLTVLLTRRNRVGQPVSVASAGRSRG